MKVRRATRSHDCQPRIPAKINGGFLAPETSLKEGGVILAGGGGALVTGGRQHSKPRDGCDGSLGRVRSGLNKGP